MAILTRPQKCTTCRASVHFLSGFPSQGGAGGLGVETCGDVWQDCRLTKRLADF